MVFAFTEDQIDQIIAQYEFLTGVSFFFFYSSLSPPLSLNYYDSGNFLDLRSQGRNMTPSLGWLIGAVMPLDAVGNVRTLEAVIDGFHFRHY